MKIGFEGKEYELLPDETVLAGLERHGAKLEAFCRAGVCQTCKVRAVQGTPPRAAQVGLKPSEVDRGCFLACMAVPEQPLSLEASESLPRFATTVARVTALGPRVLKVLLAKPDGFSFKAGQFVQLERPDGVMRPLSLASLPEDPHLELHVALRPGGALSPWLAHAEGQPVSVRGPLGDCCYTPGEVERPLILAGTGTGLSPLLGVARAAWRAGHRAPVRLWHGARAASGLYHWGALQEFVVAWPLLSVTGCLREASEPLPAVTEEQVGGRQAVGVQPLEAAVLAAAQAEPQCRAYLCGNGDMVRRLKKRLYLAGIPLDRIHSDPFVAPPAQGSP